MGQGAGNRISQGAGFVHRFEVGRPFSARAVHVVGPRVESAVAAPASAIVFGTRSFDHKGCTGRSWFERYLVCLHVNMPIRMFRSGMDVCKPQTQCASAAPKEIEACVEP